MAEPVKLDMSTAQPIQSPVALDMSTAQPIGGVDTAPQPSEAELSDQYKKARYSEAWNNLKSGDIHGAVESVASLLSNPHEHLDFPKGVAKGALQTVATTGRALDTVLPDQISEPLGLPMWRTPAMRKRLELQGTEQKVGGAAEQMAEMAATGGPLREGAVALASKLPWLGRAAAPAARIAAEALNTGGSAALHDQPVATSAALGAAGAGAGEAIDALAPKIAETALGIRQGMRGQGKTIGKAVLAETAGDRPATIARQAAAKIGDLTSQLETTADAAGQSGALATTKPATSFLDGEIAKLQSRNSPFAQKLMDLKNQLTTNQYTGAMIPENLPPRDLLELKRGVGDAINTWEPSFKRTAAPIQRKVYQLLDAELDRTVPGAADLNQRISSLIPAKTQAGKLARSAPIGQRIAGRVAAHTGALTGAALGAGLGYREGGLPTALEYGATGLVLPEMAASPTVGMAAARNASKLPLPFMRGIVTQLPKGKKDENK